MINAKELRESAEWYIKGTAAIDIDPNVVIELLDERERLLKVLNFARQLIDGHDCYLGYGFQNAIEECADIEVPE